jgi:hypothetical protein
MDRIARRVLIVAALLVSGPVAAQTFKCTNAAGKVTYSSTKCGDLGLKDAGEVPDRINVNPAYRPPRQPSAPGGRAPAAGASGAGTPAAAEPAKPPERRCFTVRTPSGGTVTRCNDKPDEDAKPGG